MQNGSMIRTERHGGPDVWEFRWREAGPDGKRKHRRMVVGTTNEFGDEVTARQAIAGLHLCMNSRSERMRVRQITVSELVDHYRQREVKPDILWKTHSTKVTFDGYLNKWIIVGRRLPDCPGRGRNLVDRSDLPLIINVHRAHNF